VLLIITFCGVLLLATSALLAQKVLRMRPDEPAESLYRPWMSDNKEKGDPE
jgi:hypothetical protein